MRMLGIALASLLFAACGTAAARTSLTSLKITAWPGDGEKAVSWTLECPGGAGSLPKAKGACARLAKLKAPFAPLPKDVVCADIYGGPQKARVRGVFRGSKVDATFSRTNGCEILRWNRVGFLFPIFSGTVPPPMR